MKKIYQEFFYIPKYGKVPEKAMLARVAVSVAVIVFCLGMMSLSAFAYFSHNVSSAKAQIQSATYELDIASEAVDGNDGYYQITNTTASDVTYKFTASCADETTASVGYCKIVAVTDRTTQTQATLANGSVINNAQFFYTNPIWKVENIAEGKLTSREVFVKVPSGETLQLWFISEWGSTANTAIQDGTAIEPIYVPNPNGQQGGEEQQSGENSTMGQEANE